MADAPGWPDIDKRPAFGIMLVDPATGNFYKVSGGSGGTAMVDQAAFAYGTSSVTPMGAVVAPSIAASIADGSIGAPIMTPARVLMVAWASAGGLPSNAGFIGTIINASSNNPIGQVTLGAGISGTVTLGANPTVIVSSGTATVNIGTAIPSGGFPIGTVANASSNNPIGSVTLGAGISGTVTLGANPTVIISSGTVTANLGAGISGTVTLGANPTVVISGGTATVNLGTAVPSGGFTIGTIINASNATGFIGAVTATVPYPTPTSTAIQAATVGLISLIAGASGRSINVYSYDLSVAASMSIAWFATPSTYMSGSMNLSALGGFAAHGAWNSPFFTCAASAGLALLASVAGQVGGYVSWFYNP